MYRAVQPYYREFARTVRLGYVETENFRVLSFSLGAAVLDSEFRADPESGLRIEQSPAGHIESSISVY